MMMTFFFGSIRTRDYQLHVYIRMRKKNWRKKEGREKSFFHLERDVERFFFHFVLLSSSNEKKKEILSSKIKKAKKMRREKEIVSLPNTKTE